VKALRTKRSTAPRRLPDRPRLLAMGNARTVGDKSRGTVVVTAQ